MKLVQNLRHLHKFALSPKASNAPSKYFQMITLGIIGALQLVPVDAHIMPFQRKILALIKTYK